MKQDYLTGLTVEELTQAFGIIQSGLSEDERTILQVYYNHQQQPLNELELQELTKANYIGTNNLTLARIAQKINAYTNVELPTRANGNTQWWSLLANQELLGGLHYTQLKPEVIKALENSGTVQLKEKRIARVCWNTKGWTQPSGSELKSENKEAYEHLKGFGWEEWLLDTQKLIDGYHYGFLQAINSHWGTYQNRLMDISLFSINGKTKERWWLGEIKNVHVIGRKEALLVYKEYEQRGWLAEMKKQVLEIGGETKELASSQFIDSFLNLKYHPKDLHILEHPVKVKKEDRAIKGAYFSTLYKHEVAPDLEVPSTAEFQFSPGHTPRKEQALFVRRESQKDVQLFHGKMQNIIYNQLVEEFGKDNVGTENNTGQNTLIDVVVKTEEGFIFYEIKGYSSLKKCIREAVSQLMEYAYFPKENRAYKLVIVAPHALDFDHATYLEQLRTNFNLPIYYQQFDKETEQLKALHH